MAEKINWARHNRQRMSHMEFRNPDRRPKRWGVRRVSDSVAIAHDMTEGAARRFAGYLTRSAPDGETFEHHRRERGV